jgi:hypothetical protein
MRPFLTCSFAWILAATAASAGAPPPPAPAAGTAVLEAKSYWRCHAVWKTELVRPEDGGELRPAEVSKGKPAPMTRTALPPADWTKPEFDDSGWARLRGPVPQGSRTVAALCLRGKFEVKDPAAAGDLALALAYRGGVIVYLNGKEAARGHLPKENSDLETPAEDYPKDAYVDPEGKLLRYGFGDPEKYKDRFALRERRLADVKLSRDLLRKGTNVLALEFHRAPTSEVFIKGDCKGGGAVFYCPWSMLLFADLKLTAPAGAAAVVPNVSRPAGLRVWGRSVVSRADAGEYPDPNEPPGALALSGCRNGAFAAQFAVGSGAAIGGLKVEASGLKPVSSAGGEEIPGSAVQLRYLKPNNDFILAGAYFRRIGLDVLEEAPAASVPAAGGGAVQPVWLTVRVPKEAKPGDYAGKVTVSAAGGAPVELAVRLKVADWTLPEPQDFAANVGLMQCPDAVAGQYGVPLWSEEHWKLLDKTFALLGYVGNDEVYIPLICGTYLGNAESMVRWVKDGDKGYKQDYTVAEKYLDLVAKHLGKPPVVSLYVWDRQGGTWGPTGVNFGEQKDPARVTLLDPASGKTERMDAPRWGTPEAVTFWKPVIDGMRERLKARGLEGSMQIGVALDHRPPKTAVADLKAAAPGVKWSVHSHMAAGGSMTTDIMGYGTHVWCSPRLVDPAAKPPYVIKNPYIFTGFPRGGVGGIGPVYNDDPPHYRWLLEGLMACGHEGFGRVGADFWPTKKNAQGKQGITYGGDAGDTSVTLSDSSPAVLAPGATGPVSTMRLEMLREGAQEAEAAMFIARALADPARKGRLGDELAGRAQALLEARVRTMLRTMGQASPCNAGCPADWGLFELIPWQADSEKLFATAGEVAAKLK